MTDVNSVVICGRVTHDVGSRDFEVLSTGTAKLKFSIAVNKSKKVNEQWVDEVSYFDVDYFGKAAEGIKPYIKKGGMVVVSGSLQQSRWEKDGEKKSRVYINASMVQLVGGKKEEGTTTPSAIFTPVNNEAMPSGDSFMDESIPF